MFEPFGTGYTLKQEDIKMSLEIKSSFDHDHNQWKMEVSGEIDISTAKDFREALEKAYSDKKNDITLHFEQLNYIDSTGLGVIIGAYGKMKEKGNRIQIINPRQNIKKLLRITNLDQILL